MSRSFDLRQLAVHWQDVEVLNGRALYPSKTPVNKKQKGYCTPDSRVVSHPSTNEAWRSLTSLIGREAVFSG